MLCYLRPFADRRLSLVARVSYTMANYGWLIGMLLWVLISYVMIGWITFQVRIGVEDSVSNGWGGGGGGLRWVRGGAGWG